MVFADIPDPPGKPEITDYDNKSVDLKWRAPKSDNGAKIEKYIVEKRNKKTGDWEKVGEVSAAWIVKRSIEPEADTKVRGSWTMVLDSGHALIIISLNSLNA